MEQKQKRGISNYNDVLQCNFGKQVNENIDLA